MKNNTVNFDAGVEVRFLSRIIFFHSFHFLFSELHPKRANFPFNCFILSTLCCKDISFSVLQSNLTVKPDLLKNLIRKYAQNDDLVINFLEDKNICEDEQNQ